MVARTHGWQEPENKTSWTDVLPHLCPPDSEQVPLVIRVNPQSRDYVNQDWKQSHLPTVIWGSSKRSKENVFLKKGIQKVNL